MKLKCDNCQSDFEWENKNKGRGSTPKYCSQSCNQKAWAKRNPTKVVENRAQLKRKNPKAFILSRLKNRAKKMGLSFDLSEEDIDLIDTCPVLGIPVRCTLGVNLTKGYHPNSLSIDRIDHTKGYVKGNIRSISARANLLKNNSTVEELEKVLNDLRKIRDEAGGV